MKEHPILFSGPMVRAILAVRKTQTRRVIKPRGRVSLFDGSWSDDYVLEPGNASWREAAYPWRVGDCLWVRESFAIKSWDEYQYFWFSYDADGACSPAIYMPDDYLERACTRLSRAGVGVDGLYQFGDDHRQLLKRPSIHMPRAASRITLEVTGVKVERLQDISEDDAFAEGVCQFVEDSDKVGWGNLTADDRAAIVRSTYGSAVQAFRHLWETINGEESWDANPWVVAIAFKRMEV